MFKSQREANATAQQALETKLRENAELESYRPKLAEIERQLASLKQQLEIERKIVPDEKEVPGFIKMMDAEAMKAGHRTAPLYRQAGRAKDFYTEVPFEIELDGPYYSMLNFFDQVGKLERIVNVSGLLVATTKKPTDAKASTPISTRRTRALWPPARRRPSSVMTWNHRRARRENQGNPRRRKSRGPYEADDWNSFTGDGGGNCLGAEPRTSSRTRGTR